MHKIAIKLPALKKKKFINQLQPFAKTASYNQKKRAESLFNELKLLFDMRRKILSMFVLLAATAGFVSCDEDLEYMRNGVSDDVDWTTKKVTVQERDWIYQSNHDNSGGYYYADIKVRDLNSDVFRGGIVCCYMYDGNDVQIPLPCTRTMSDGTHEWQRTIDFEFYRKGITFYVTDYIPQTGITTTPSDNFEPDEPGEMKFRIVLLE